MVKAKDKLCCVTWRRSSGFGGNVCWRRQRDRMSVPDPGPGVSLTRSIRGVEFAWIERKCKVQVLCLVLEHRAPKTNKLLPLVSDICGFLSEKKEKLLSQTFCIYFQIIPCCTITTTCGILIRCCTKNYPPVQ